MKLRLLALYAFTATCLGAVPATAQTVAGCGVTAIPKADQGNVPRLTAQATCFERAGIAATSAASVRRARVTALTQPATPIASPLAPAPAPTSSPAVNSLAIVPKTEFGINVAPSVYYNTERTFANLAMASGGWANVTVAGVRNGYPVDGQGTLQLNVPRSVWAGRATEITCTWAGAAGFTIDGQHSGDRYGDHSITTTWKGFTFGGPGRPEMFLQLKSNSVTDPVRDLDCREAGVVVNGLFDQRAIDDLKSYKVIRFLDWSQANGNPASVTWAGRTTRELLTQNGQDQVALENMVDLANAAGADAWFTIPLNADREYVEKAAALVASRLSPRHRAYFELSNETWNFGFGQATQLLNEGLAEKLSPDKYTNNLLRYAERHIEFAKALTPAFAANSSRLVRVIDTQSDNTWAMDRIMEFRDAAAWVDAVATAPYFGNGLLSDPAVAALPLPDLFDRLEAKRVESIARAVTYRTRVVGYWKKRSIAYEAGQHIISTIPAAAAMQRSELMHDAYARYAADWRSKVGDTLLFYSHTGTISQYGAWGIREWAGQPLGETPKRRAVLEAIAKP